MEHGFPILPIGQNVRLGFSGNKTLPSHSVAQVTDLWHKCLDLGIGLRPEENHGHGLFLVLEIRRKTWIIN